MTDTREAYLYTIIDSFPKVLIAYSGGVDSACLLYAAYQRLNDCALGIIADSPSLPRTELDAALKLAKFMGVQVEVVRTDEFTDPNYLANPNNRCYFCKHALFKEMEELAIARQFPILAYGENADDANQWRPGGIAAKEFKVRAPLKEAGLTKKDIRDLCAKWNLPVADKPASPCLSSRIPHGTPVTETALAQIETSEEAIRALGFRVFRVRHHGMRARIEFAKDEMDRAQSFPWHKKIIEAALAVGYQEVEIDPHGYRSPAIRLSV